MWRHTKRSLFWALIVALCGATAGIVYVAVTSGPVASEMLKGAVTGAILASVIYTALKLWLDL